VRTLRRTFLPPLALLAFLVLAHGARAAGVSVRWNSCSGDGGVQNQSFACDTNAGSEVLVGSFTLGANMAQVSGNEIVIDLASAGSLLPQWWAFKTIGTCRQASMTLDVLYQGACPDWASGNGVGGIAAYSTGQRGPNTSRIRLATAVPAHNIQDLSAGQEYFSFKISIDNLKTVGSASCAGCLTPVCLVLQSVRVNTPVPVNDRTLTGPANATDSDWATWQGGGGVVVGGNSGCPRALPTERRSWGAVKALYH
jgi:hypothetical protein